MAEAKQSVRLHGNALSGYSMMIRYALKLKGVGHEYVEEDLQNKTSDLLELNPVYKKVLVLVVDGKPVAESLIILQYLDDLRKDPPFDP